jgi:hypothetical protein
MYKFPESNCLLHKWAFFNNWFQVLYLVYKTCSHVCGQLVRVGHIILSLVLDYTNSKIPLSISETYKTIVLYICLVGYHVFYEIFCMWFGLIYHDQLNCKYCYIHIIYNCMTLVNELHNHKRDHSIIWAKKKVMAKYIFCYPNPPYLYVNVSILCFMLSFIQSELISKIEKLSRILFYNL